MVHWRDHVSEKLWRCDCSGPHFLSLRRTVWDGDWCSMSIMLDPTSCREIRDELDKMLER
jgi:hypothetical protein